MRADLKGMVVVGLAAALWGAVYLRVTGLDRRSPSAEQTDIAVHVMRGHGFRSPFDASPEAPPTAWSPPVYPAVLAGVFALTGTAERPITVEGVRWLGWVNAGALGVVAGCGFLLVRRGYPGRGGVVAGLLAGVLVALHPMVVRFVGDYWDGMVALAMFFGLLVLADPRTGAKGAGRCVAVGALGGLLLLTNTAYVLAVLAVAGMVTGVGGGGGKGGAAAAVRRGVYVLAAMGAVLMPWTLRNLAAFERVMLVRSGAGVELWLGNREGLLGWMGPEVLEMHPYRNAVERERVLRVGEAAYSAEKAGLFREALAADPWGFAARSARRAAYLAVGEPAARYTAWPLSNERTEVPGLGRIYLGRTAVLSGLTAAGLAGMWVMWRRRGLGSGGLVWAGMMGVLAVAPYVVTSASDRYALPVRAVLAVLSAAAVAEGVRMAGERRGAWGGRTAPTG